jgi:ATP-binding cassette subfamily B protein
MFGGNDGLRRMMDQETIKPKNVGATLGRFGRYFTRYWPVLLTVALLVVVSTWAQVSVPDLIGQAVDCYLTPGAVNLASAAPGVAPDSAASSNCWLMEDADRQGLTQNLTYNLLTAGGFAAPTPSQTTAEQSLAGVARLTLMIVGLYVISAVLTGASFYGMTWAGSHVLRSMREDLFQQLHRLSLGYYAEHESGDLMSRITNDSDTIQQAFSFALLNVVSGMLLVGWIGYNMLRDSLPLALLSLVVVPLMALATFWFSAQARKAFRRTRQEMGSVNAELQESISAVREVQAFNRADENIESFRATNAANRDANIRAVSFTTALAPTLEGLGYLALAIVACVGGLMLLSGREFLGTAISLGLLIAFLTYVQRFNQPIQQIAVLWTNVQNAIAGGERIFSLLDETPGLVDAPEAVEMPQIQGTVEFDNVSAAYLLDQPVLDGVNFRAEPGQMVAIVGPTGAGKTTIINLLPRFYDVVAGAIRIDGYDVRSVTAKSLRSQIGIVLQDTFLFSTTVLENIRFGKPDASDEEVMQAARLAHAHSFIERLPQGYQTVLGERGSGLSQGQRQLVSIARAALADPRILILDEATSSVDTRTERLIQQALDQLLAGRTSFVIAHRLSTIQHADQVLVLDQGKIVERGTHAELLNRKGFYYNLYMSQFWRPELEQAPEDNGRFRSPHEHPDEYRDGRLAAAS